MPATRFDITVTNPGTSLPETILAGTEIPTWAIPYLGGTDPAQAVTPPPSLDADITAWRQHADLLGIIYALSATKEELIEATT